MGLVTTLQLDPFQCSVSAWAPLFWSPELPTAQTSLAETAATPLRTLLLFPLGLGTTLQLQEVELYRFWKSFQLDGEAFASVVLSDRALSRTITTHSSMATLRKRFIMCPPDFIFSSINIQQGSKW
ncbi:MAG: hypothetical protein ACJ795_05110 [Ktedonobacteraceae bacterium]